MTVSEFMALLEREIALALRSGDRVGLGVARTLRAAVANAEAVPQSGGSEPLPFGEAEVPRRRLTAHDLRDLVAAELSDRTEVREDYVRRGTGALQQLDAEIARVEAYLALLTTE